MIVPNEQNDFPALVVADDLDSDEDKDADKSSTTPTMYKYRDFGAVSEEQLQAMEGGNSSNSNSPSTSPTPPFSPPSSAASSRGNHEGASIRVQKFPVKLYTILSKNEFNQVITWMPHGRSWKVLKPHLFESMVMPLFFEYSNYHSFNRLINAWSFRRVSSGPDRGSYYHELFLRGKPALHKFMRRLPKTHKKLPMKKEDEPDFYKLDKANPLPPMEEVTSPTMSPNGLGGIPSMSGLPQQAGLGNLAGGAAGMMMNPRGGPSSAAGGGMVAGGAGIPTGFHNLSAASNSQYDPLSRDPLLVGMGGAGMGMGMTNSIGSAAGMGMSMGMGGMGMTGNSIGPAGMGLSNTIGGAAGMMNGMMAAGMHNMHGMSAGIQALREQPGMNLMMGGAGGSGDPLLGNVGGGPSSAFATPRQQQPQPQQQQATPELEDQYERLRQIQQMQLYDRSTTPPRMMNNINPIMMNRPQQF